MPKHRDDHFTLSTVSNRGICMKEKLQKLRQNKLYQQHQEKVKFVLVGGTNFLLDLGIYTLLANVLGWHQIPANVISVTIAMCFSFYMNYHYVWHSKKNLYETIVGFLAVSMFSNYLVQNAVISLVSMIIGDGDFQNIVCKICTFWGLLSHFIVIQ